MAGRAERVAEAQRLRDEHLLMREIAERMGLALSTIDAYLNDPDGSKQKARKDGYRGTCKECGKPTDGSRGKGKAPEYCLVCVMRRRKKWSRERIVAMIREWADIYGEPPHADDWNPHSVKARNTPHAPEIERRFRDGEWPHLTTVTRYFGSWNEAIEAAGFKGRAQSPGPSPRVLPKRKRGRR